jgi:hypothetical protein
MGLVLRLRRGPGCLGAVVLGLTGLSKPLMEQVIQSRHGEESRRTKQLLNLDIGSYEPEMGLPRLKAFWAVLEKRAQKPERTGSMTIVHIHHLWDLEPLGNIFSTGEDLVAFSFYSELAKLIGTQSALILFGQNAKKVLVPKLVSLALNKKLSAKEILEDLIPSLTNVLQKNSPLEPHNEEILGHSFDWNSVKDKLEIAKRGREADLFSYLTLLRRQIETTLDWALLLN